MAETKTKRHPLAIAWDQWLASGEGREARAANTLPHNTDRYLENRLHRAFDAGARAATISPSDFEQLTRLREAAEKFVTAYEGKEHQLGNGQALRSFLQFREALAQRSTGGEKL